MRNLTRPVQRLADTLHDSILHLRVKCLKLFDSRGNDVAVTFDGDNYQQLLIGGEVFADSGMGAKAEAAAARAENAIAILDVYEDKAAASAAAAEAAEEMARRWAELPTSPIEGDLTRKSAKTWAGAAEIAAGTAAQSADAAKASETTARDYVDTYAGLTAEATTLAPGSSATADFNAASGRLRLGVPRGEVGPVGPPVPLSDSVSTADSTIAASSLAVKTVMDAIPALSDAYLLGDSAVAASTKATQALYELMSALEPRGVVKMWYGELTAIPSGWALCDGTNGTPDLRDRFVVGAGGNYALGVTGGAASATPSVSVQGTTLDGNTTGVHAHLYQPTYRIGDSGEINGNALTGAGNDTIIGKYMGIPAQWTDNACNGWAHAHPAFASAVSTIPPFFGLYFIMKL